MQLFTKYIEGKTKAKANYFGKAVDGVEVGDVKRRAERYDRMKIKPTKLEAEYRSSYDPWHMIL